jgi:hypothetical protein
MTQNLPFAGTRDLVFRKTKLTRVSIRTRPFCETNPSDPSVSAGRHFLVRYALSPVPRWLDRGERFGDGLLGNAKLRPDLR